VLIFDIMQSQGMSIADLEVNMSGIFANGQAYVALSRAVDFRRLTINGYKKNLILTNGSVCQYYEEEILAHQQESALSLQHYNCSDNSSTLLEEVEDIYFTETSLFELWNMMKLAGTSTVISTNCMLGSAIPCF
jgi:hypothetical protein